MIRLSASGGGVSKSTSTNVRRGKRMLYISDPNNPWQVVTVSVQHWKAHSSAVLPLTFTVGRDHPPSEPMISDPYVFYATPPLNTALVFRPHLNLLKMICNDFLPTSLKVVSSCLLQYKPVCVTNFDKLCRKMPKEITSLLVFLV